MSDPLPPEPTVDAAPADRSVLKALSATLAAVSPVCLREPGQDPGEPTLPPGSVELPAVGASAGRYRLDGEIGRGGMGAILKGRDPDLGRDVAVKVLLETHRDKPELVRRFVEEAQIAGQLQHPGVVPVYELGQFSDQRPYFAMKLVKGRTLAELLAERADAAQDRPRFLNVFEQMCQTLAYAHSRGVIHRDLKPSNVMVGAFGEVQVMDWGLAKVLAEGGAPVEREAPPQDVSVIRTARSGEAAGDGTRTYAGSVLGTPAYMAPEQALGDVGLIDQRCDVFGLGAILCEVLTGGPPYRGRHAEETRRMAANADQAEARARLDACKADAELVDLVKTCLAAESADRPRDAQAVAARVSAYLNGVQERLRCAELDRAAAEARAEEARGTARAERRARQRLAGLSAAALLLAGAGGWWLWQRTAADRDVDAALAEVTAALERRDWPAGQAGIDRAEARLAGWGSSSRRQKTERIQQDLAAVRRMEEIFIDAHAGRMGPPIFPELDAAFADTFRTLGIDPDTQTPQEMARRLRARTAPAQLGAALDGWAWLRRKGMKQEESRWRPLLEAAALADDDPTRNRLRTILIAKDWPALKQLARDLDPSNHSTLTLALVGQYLQETSDLATTLDFLRTARLHHPEDFALNSLLAGVLCAPMRMDSYREATVYLNAALAVRPHSVPTLNQLASAHIHAGQSDVGIQIVGRMLALDPVPNVQAHAHNLLGMAWHYKDDLDRSIAEHREAVRLVPDSPGFRHNLAVSLALRNDLSGGLAACDEAIRLAVASGSPMPSTHSLRGDILSLQGKHDEALAAHREALRTDRSPFSRAMDLANFGKALQRKRDLAGALDPWREVVKLDPDAPNHCELGDLLRDLKRPDEAVVEYRQALHGQPTYALAWEKLGRILNDKGRFGEGEACLRMAVALEPKEAARHYNLGLCLSRRGRYAEAIPAFREAIRLDPKNADAHSDLGICLQETGALPEAMASFNKAFTTRPAGEARYRLGIGNVLFKKQDYDGAKDAFQRCVDLDPNYAMAHDNLGNVLLTKGRLDEAMAAERRAIALDPNLPFAYKNLALALLRRKSPDEALAVIRERIAREPEDAQAHYVHGLALRDLGQIDEAMTAWRRALELAPLYALPRLLLGLSLQRQGHFTEGLAALAFAHEIGSTLPGWDQPSAEWLRQAEKLVERNALLDAVAKGEVKPAGPAERIEFAQAAKFKKRFAAAVRLYEQAFVEQPPLAEDRKSAHRFDAACYAARAAAGEGDGTALDAKERDRLRKQALDWLRADLAAWAKHLDKGGAAARAVAVEMLRHWQRDSDLACLREPTAVARLSAGEQQACKKLWDEVEALLRKAAG